MARTEGLSHATPFIGLTAELTTPVKNFDDEYFSALPGIQLANDIILALKGALNDGQRGCTLKKACAYLGFRVISYSCIPLALNLVSALLTLVLGIITLPTRICGNNLNAWLWRRFVGSLGFLAMSLFDLTYDFRQATGKCCCAPESQYLAV